MARMLNIKKCCGRYEEVSNIPFNPVPVPVSPRIIGVREQIRVAIDDLMNKEKDVGVDDYFDDFDDYVDCIDDDVSGRGNLYTDYEAKKLSIPPEAEVAEEVKENIKSMPPADDKPSDPS